MVRERSPSPEVDLSSPDFEEHGDLNTSASHTGRDVLATHGGYQIVCLRNGLVGIRSKIVVHFARMNYVAPVPKWTCLPPNSRSMVI
jgi:hypothetical protein